MYKMGLKKTLLQRYCKDCNLWYKMSVQFIAISRSSINRSYNSLFLKFQSSTSHYMALWFERIKASPKTLSCHEKISFLSSKLRNQDFAQNTGIQHEKKNFWIHIRIEIFL